MSTPILPFAPWESGTNQNSIPANDNALRSQILNGLVISDSTDAQPGSPSAGDIYIMTGSASGTQWSTFDEFDLAIYDGVGTWHAYAPVEGIFVNIDGSLYSWDGSAYVPVTTGTPAAEDVSYDNAVSGLTATDVQGAIDELEGMIGGSAVTSVNGDTGAVIVPVPIGIACSDETTALTTGAAKATFRMPFAMTLTAVRASLTTAQTSGSIITVDINEAGASILSTKITIDNTEKTSTTAATPPVISDASLADDAEMTIDIDQIGDGTAKGLKVWLIGYPA